MRFPGMEVFIRTRANQIPTRVTQNPVHVKTVKSRTHESRVLIQSETNKTFSLPEKRRAKMWRRLVSSSTSASLKTLASSSRRSSLPTRVRPLTSVSSSSPSNTTTFPSHSPISSPSGNFLFFLLLFSAIIYIDGFDRMTLIYLIYLIQGRTLLEANYPIGPFGTKEAPAIVKSFYDRRIVGCPGGEGEDEHDVVWFWLHKDQPHVCPVCSQHFKTRYLGRHMTHGSTMSAARIRETITECLSKAQSDSPEVQQKALQTWLISPRSSTTLQALSLSILFYISLNPNLKQSLAEMETIYHLNSIILSLSSPESSRLASSLICSLAMLDKNKAKFGVAGTIQSLVTAVSDPGCPAAHHLLSSLAELVRFHGNCTLAVRSGAVPVLIQVAQSNNSEDLAGTSLAILGLLARFEEGLNALRKTDQIVNSMVDVLKGRCMLSKEGAAEILLRLFDESEGCVRDALRLPEFPTVLADLSIRGSARAREKGFSLSGRVFSAAIIMLRMQMN
ncbi:Cytochrome c oxidase subunit 5b-2, mitochondrial [Vitis vinifera]|uniref:Cytochrome c oxidase subunit 5b-2, mitochondrial n=1 Tax=Vitis vinifera TaxID=29760 RepID=A0A438F237_VITVI|nr:Cytochrome c oxidase subunit 5b-2, mitochondrial [Vitis vinifera]